MLRSRTGKYGECRSNSKFNNYNWHDALLKQHFFFFKLGKFCTISSFKFSNKAIYRQRWSLEEVDENYSMDISKYRCHKFVSLLLRLSTFWIQWWTLFWKFSLIEIYFTSLIQWPFWIISFLLTSLLNKLQLGDNTCRKYFQLQILFLWYSYRYMEFFWLLSTN